MNRTDVLRLDDGMTVNEIIGLYPETVEIFNRHGIDACCGGSVPLREAAIRDGADPMAVLGELRQILERR
jgi:regulator of cell morphogenesis and NO signaling